MRLRASLPLLAVLTSLSLSATSCTTPPPADPTFDLQAHRGGLGEWTEESLPAFRHALEAGVSTLELDTMLTKDQRIVVWHDDTIQTKKCRDTAPAGPGDPKYPYAGSRVADLTLAQLKTLDCGYQQLPGHPDQRVAKGNRIAELGDVFDLVRTSGAGHVQLNIETKVEDGKAGGPEGAALTRAVLEEVDEAGMGGRVMLQSFDWSTLNLARDLAESGEAPEVPLVALTGGGDHLQVGEPGAAPGLGGIDIDDFGGSLADAAASQGYAVLSPAQEIVSDTLVEQAHAVGLKVIPWTVDQREAMERLLELGVDGIITNYPTRLRDLLGELDMPVPPSLPRAERT